MLVAAGDNCAALFTINYKLNVGAMCVHESQSPSEVACMLKKQANKQVPDYLDVVFSRFHRVFTKLVSLGFVVAHNVSSYTVARAVPHGTAQLGTCLPHN